MRGATAGDRRRVGRVRVRDCGWWAKGGEEEAEHAPPWLGSGGGWDLARERGRDLRSVRLQLLPRRLTAMSVVVDMKPASTPPAIPREFGSMKLAGNTPPATQRKTVTGRCSLPNLTMPELIAWIVVTNWPSVWVRSVLL